MGVLPANKVPGDILTAAEFNQLLTARDGFLHPIDPSTRDEDDNIQDLGSASNRWKDLHANGAVLGATDDVIIGGKSLTTILEDNRIDTNASKELFRNTVSGGTVMLTNSFVKSAGDLLVRILITATSDPAQFTSDVRIAFTNGKVETRDYSFVFTSGSLRGAPISSFTEWFDVSQVTNGATVQIDVTALGGGVNINATTYAFKNAF